MLKISGEKPAEKPKDTSSSEWTKLKHRAKVLAPLAAVGAIIGAGKGVSEAALEEALKPLFRKAKPSGKKIWKLVKQQAGPWGIARGVTGGGSTFVTGMAMSDLMERLKTKAKSKPGDDVAMKEGIKAAETLAPEGWARGMTLTQAMNEARIKKYVDHTGQRISPDIKTAMGCVGGAIPAGSVVNAVGNFKTKKSKKHKKIAMAVKIVSKAKYVKPNLKKVLSASPEFTPTVEHSIKQLKNVQKITDPVGRSAGVGYYRNKLKQSPTLRFQAERAVLSDRMNRVK